VLMRRLDVDEVDVQPVDLGHELRQGVQLRFDLRQLSATSAAPSSVVGRDSTPDPALRRSGARGLSEIAAGSLCHCTKNAVLQQT
jgi:hypothetical protein